MVKRAASPASGTPSSDSATTKAATPSKLTEGNLPRKAADDTARKLADQVAALKAEVSDLRTCNELHNGDYAYLMGKVSRLRHENASLRRTSKLNAWMLGASVVMNLLVLGKLRSLT